MSKLTVSQSDQTRGNRSNNHTKELYFLEKHGNPNGWATEVDKFRMSIGLKPQKKEV